MHEGQHGILEDPKKGKKGRKHADPTEAMCSPCSPISIAKRASLKHDDDHDHDHSHDHADDKPANDTWMRVVAIAISAGLVIGYIVWRFF